VVLVESYLLGDCATGYKVRLQSLGGRCEQVIVAQIAWTTGFMCYKARLHPSRLAVWAADGGVGRLVVYRFLFPLLATINSEQNKKKGIL
jgi:hypothetical protein